MILLIRFNTFLSKITTRIRNNYCTVANIKDCAGRGIVKLLTLLLLIVNITLNTSTISENERCIYTRREGTEKVTKEMQGFKPGGRHKEKSMVEVPSVRHEGKVEVDTSESVISAIELGTVHRSSNRPKEVASGREDSKLPVNRLERVSRQVLQDWQVRISAQDKVVSRASGPGQAESRPRGFEKSVSKPKPDLASRFEDKFPLRQSINYDKVSGLPSAPREDGIEKRSSILVNSMNWQSAGQEKPVARSKMHGKSNMHGESHERPIENASVRHQQEALDKLQKRHPHLQEKFKEVREREKLPKNAKHQAHPKRTKGYIEGAVMAERVSALSQKPPTHSHEKPIDLCERVQAKSTKAHLHQEVQERHEKMPTHSQRLILKSHMLDKTFATSSKSPHQQTVPLIQTLLMDDEDLQEQTSPQLLIQRQSPRERISSQSHRPHIRETETLERSVQRQYPNERPISVHEHETKLIQRQKYLQDKVRSRKMLLGSVIPSDMIFLSEACRNWQLTTILSSRYKDQKSWSKLGVLSADSGCSMGEGSSASRRNSETETDDQLNDNIPTIIADVGETVHHRVPSKCIKCQRMRCEKKDASSQHSHPPSESESPSSSPYTESLASGSFELTALDVRLPPPPDRIYQCRVIRDKNTYGTMFYPVYRMYLERDGRPEILLLTARKRKKCSTSKYLICTGNDELRRKSSSLVGKLRSNLVGTRFHLATYVKGSDPEDDESRPESPEQLKFDSLLLFYETNFLGTKGPRRMKVFLPEVDRTDQELNLLERVSDGSLEGVLTLVNKEPEWDRETLSHILYFEGRVTKSSVKNFQLVRPPDESSVLLQFGKVGRNEFTLDYQTPMSAVQAFAIALSSFDGKIACE